MHKNYSISITLDRRRKKADGTFPVKLRVFTPDPREQKLYVTVFSFTEKKFSSIWETVKPRKEHKIFRKKLKALEVEADKVADSLTVFSFKEFERLMFNKTDATISVNYYFDKAIERHKKRQSISTAKGYDTALKCLLRFHNKPVIQFKDITVSYLEQFEQFCVEEEKKSLTTVGIYLRNLRAVFNDAIAEKVIPADLYPFGVRKFRIQAPLSVKKALSSEQLKLLFEGKPQTPQQEKAKAFWFFSYLCNGMNFHDILNMKCKDIESDKITFTRGKTARTTKNPKPITIFLNDFSKEVINKYGNTNQNPDEHVFRVFDNNQTPEQKHRKKQNFIRSINQHFLKYAKSLGVNEKISSYWARHSYATMAVRKGATMEFISESFGHTNLKTTMGYFQGFENSTKKDISKKLLDF